MIKRIFKIELFENVTDDIQEAVDFYNSKQKHLGTKFYNATNKALNSLKTDALLYQKKYKNIRCIKLNKFPYLIHYKVIEKLNTVKVYAIISSLRDPNSHWVVDEK